jgi:hypothetical protein
MQNKNGHHPESKSSRADKMSGLQQSTIKQRKLWKRLGVTLKEYKLGWYGKHFYNRKRRMFLKNKHNWDKI